MPPGGSKSMWSLTSTPPSTASKRCVWTQRRNGPSHCSSTNKRSGSKAVNEVTARCGMPQRRPRTTTRAPRQRRSGASSRRRCSSGGDTSGTRAGCVRKSKMSFSVQPKVCDVSKTGMLWTSSRARVGALKDRRGVGLLYNAGGFPSFGAAVSPDIFHDALILTGPTGSGKTQLSLALAEQLGAEIVSMDSMALYRGLDIAAAKPGPTERARVAHHLLDVLDPWKSASVEI